VRTQWFLGAAGLALAAYGGWLLLGTDLADLPGVGVWLAAGVLLHDAVLVPLTLLVGWVLVRRLPRRLRGPLAAGLLVLGSVTLLAVPVLGRFGAREDNPTLLDRDYAAGWLVLAALTAAGVAVAALRAGRGTGREAGRSRGPRARR
jgi:hypothetical protein